MFATHRYCLAQSILPQLNTEMRELVAECALFSLNPDVRVFCLYTAFFIVVIIQTDS